MPQGTPNLDAQIRKLGPAIVGMRRALHAIPEPAYAEHMTSRYVAGILAELGFRPRSVAGTGIICDIEGTDKSRVVAIRADMDALPVDEKTGLECSSRTPGMMHACGHDGHMAILLGVAMALAGRRETLPCTVRLVFQPAEERAPRGGAESMIQAGALKNVCLVLGYHIMPDFPSGSVVIQEGPVMAAADEFEIVIRGKGGHASAPEKTTDTILVAAKVVDSFPAIVSRMVSPLDAAVISCGEIRGGSAFNIIPDAVTIKGTVRTYDPALRDSIAETMRSMTAGICRAFGAGCDFEYVKCYPAVVNDGAAVEFLRDVATAVYGRNGITSTRPFMGSEDFSRYLEKVPGCYAFIGGGSPGEKHVLHTPTYTFDERALVPAVQFLTRAVINSYLWT